MDKQWIGIRAVNQDLGAARLTADGARTLKRKVGTKYELTTNNRKVRIFWEVEEGCYEMNPSAE